MAPRTEPAPDSSASQVDDQPTRAYSEPSAAQASADSLAAAALAAMAAAWRTGEPMPAEQWLEQFPDLAARPELAARVIFEEVCLREEAGEPVESVEIYRRFPQWREALAVVLDCHRLMGLAQRGSAFPEAGQKLGDLRLLHEIGRGGMGRVFLATQPTLSDRPLVVKITPRTGNEHLSLARLQHTYIAPLYLVQDFPERNVRALCMPYLGGASWWQILQAIKTTPLAQRTGREIVTVLEAGDAARPAATRGPALSFLARSSYVDAVCWIGSCLADALHYAHQRGLVHLDIKPSNVLLAGDGQPMLLDFHLAREVVEAGRTTVDRLGGTRGYMSPEQKQCAQAIHDGRPMPAALDGRSDVYSLGLLLYESLAGQLPDTKSTGSPHFARALRNANPLVSPGVADLVAKCLDENPARRYDDAGQLAADLRRHLASMPLRGVANRSVSERWRKWRQRQPHALLTLAACVIAAVILAASAWVIQDDRHRQASSALELSKESFAAHDFSSAAASAAAGSAAIRWLPWQSRLQDSLDRQRALAVAAERTAALHKLVEQLRFVDSLEHLPAARLRAFEAGCGKLWQSRQAFLAADSPDRWPEKVDAPGELTDLALLWTRLRLRLAAPQELTRTQAACAQVLDEAQALCGSSPAIELSRRMLNADAVSTDFARLSSQAVTARQHDALGRVLLQSGELDAARQQFAEALRREPSLFWANFHLAACAYRQQDYAGALNAAGICVALAPDRAECYYNRALCRQALGQAQGAEEDFARAAELDPALAQLPAPASAQ